MIILLAKWYNEKIDGYRLVKEDGSVLFIYNIVTAVSL